MEPVIANLLSNALKYSRPETPVTVRVAQQGNTVGLCIMDRGVGIPAEDVPHLFQRFYRAWTAQRHRGLGLSLYISRLIVEAHGGTIWTESKVGVGSTFCLVLPRLMRRQEVAAMRSVARLAQRYGGLRNLRKHRIQY